MQEGAARELLLERLTGIKSSKRTYYSAYREKERRLDRAIASIADIAAALSRTTDGVPSLMRAVVQVAAQHFAANWAIVVLTTTPPQRWVACRDYANAIVLESALVPAMLDTFICQVLAEQRLVITGKTHAPEALGAPMFLRDQVIGALAVVPSPGLTLDEREISVLQTLANQAAVAVANARLYEETYRQKIELEEKNRQLAKARQWLAVARQNEIVNNERNRIARELHDSVAQHLISIGMNLEWCRTQLHAYPLIYDRICVAKELARNAITRMREAIFELSTIHQGSSGLIAALRELAVEFEKTSRLQVRFRAVHEPQPLSADIEHALYHIAQEALFNVQKHAQACNVSIELRFKPDTVQLVITDDGIGIPEAILCQRKTIYAEGTTAHFGLRNMRDRAQELGGRIRIRRRRGGGTAVYATIPIRVLNRSAYP